MWKVSVAEVKMDVLDYATILDMKKVAQARTRIEELKADGSLPEPFARADFSKARNLSEFTASQYGIYELAEYLDGFPSGKKLDKACVYYRQIKPKEGKPCATIEDVEEFEAKFIEEKVNERDKAIAEHEYLTEKLKEKQPFEKQYKKKIKKANRMLARAKFGNFVRHFLGFAFKVAVVVGIFMLPQATGLGALFLGSTNSFLGTIGCAIASYYGLKAFGDHLSGYFDAKYKSAEETAKKMKEDANSETANKIGKECSSMRDRIAELEATLKTMDKNLSDYDADFVSKADRKRVDKFKEELYQADSAEEKKGGKTPEKEAEENKGGKNPEKGAEEKKEEGSPTKNNPKAMSDTERREKEVAEREAAVAIREAAVPKAKRDAEAAEAAAETETGEGAEDAQDVEDVDEDAITGEDAVDEDAVTGEDTAEEDAVTGEDTVGEDTAEEDAAGDDSVLGLR